MADDGRHDPSEVVESASAVAGALATVGASVVIGPLAGSAGGALVQRAFRYVGAEFERRVIAPRQAKRIAAAAEAAGDAIKTRLEGGEETRSDGFFDVDGDGESPADELLEGVLRTAADAWEKRKVPYIGRLFSGMSFDSSVSIAEGSYLLRLADRLTYRQLALLAFWDAAQEGRRYERAALSLEVEQDTQGGRPTPALTAEMDELMRAGMLGVARDEGLVGPPQPTWAGIADAGSLRGTDLAEVRLTHLGETLHNLLGLGRMPVEDVDDVLRAVRGESD